MFGHFDWDNDTFVHFLNTNKLQKKRNKKGTKKANHFWFNAVKPEKTTTNDFAHHFMRHIRNAFAHGLITKVDNGKKLFDKGF